jgi:glycosyltransferase involved in cell wall biosynthesis
MCKVVIPRAKQMLTLQTTNRNFLRGHILRTPDTVTAISKTLASQAASLGRSDVTVIPNGIPYQEIIHACENVPKTEGRILFVGRLEEMKGVGTLLHAFMRLPQEARLHIVGNGSLKLTLERLARTLHCSDRVTFLGRLEGPALFHEYAQAQIFCGLSRSEALGNVFLEAQAAGCAVVATNIGGIPEIVKNGETGLLVPPGEPEAAAQTLSKLLTEHELRHQLGYAGKHHARAYDWATIAEQYARAYEALLG